jgi:hypothetical protein
MKRIILILLTIIAAASFAPAQGRSDDHSPEVVQARRDAAKALSELKHGREGHGPYAEARYFQPGVWPSEHPSAMPEGSIPHEGHSEEAGPDPGYQGDDDYGLSYCIICGCGKVNHTWLCMPHVFILFCWTHPTEPCRYPFIPQ